MSRLCEKWTSGSTAGVSASRTPGGDHTDVVTAGHSAAVSTSSSCTTSRDDTASNKVVRNAPPRSVLSTISVIGSNNIGPTSRPGKSPVGSPSGHLLMTATAVPTAAPHSSCHPPVSVMVHILVSVLTTTVVVSVTLETLSLAPRSTAGVVTGSGSTSILHVIGFSLTHHGSGHSLMVDHR